MISFKSSLSSQISIKIVFIQETEIKAKAYQPSLKSTYDQIKTMLIHIQNAEGRQRLEKFPYII